MQQQNIIARYLTPKYLTDIEVAHFQKSHRITHGTYIGKDGKAKPRAVAIMLIDPDDPRRPHWHIYTNNINTAKRIMYTHFKKEWQPWRKDHPKRQASTFSYGTEFPNDRKAEPVICDQWLFKLVKWQGNTSQRSPGPYWTRIPGVEMPDIEPTEPTVWLQGRLVEVGQVDDMLVDTVQYLENNYAGLSSEADAFIAHMNEMYGQ